jgi:hypothetical protein
VRLGEELDDGCRLPQLELLALSSSSRGGGGSLGIIIIVGDDVQTGDVRDGGEGAPFWVVCLLAPARYVTSWLYGLVK